MEGSRISKKWTLDKICHDRWTIGKNNLHSLPGEKHKAEIGKANGGKSSGQ